MKKILLFIVVIAFAIGLVGCDIDLNDDSHDNDYIRISSYYEYDEELGEVVKLYYIPKTTFNLKFYVFEELEVVGNIDKLSYGLGENYDITSNEPINIYSVATMKWESIPEIHWLYAPNKLQDDVLVEYGSLPSISNDYEPYSVVRVFYQDTNLSLHYMLVKVDEFNYIRFGDIRELL